MQLEQTVAEVAALVRGELLSGSGELRLSGLRSLELAGPHELAAVFRAGYVAAAHASKAGCLLVGKDFKLPESAGAGPEPALITVENPELAVNTVVATWGPRELEPAVGVHPSAVVEPGAEVDPSAAVGPWVFVGRGARIGPGSRLWPRVYVGAGSEVGAGCRLYPGSYVGDRCTMGDRVILHAGAVLGADGFGFQPGPGGVQLKSPQVGIVALGDDVEVGANTTIDRARLEATVIGNGVKLDDQVHIGHNCEVGENTAIAAHCSLAGGAVVGKNVLMAGHCGVSGSGKVSDGAVLGACTIVVKQTPPGQYMIGFPAVSHRQWKRQALSLERLPALIADMKAARSGGSPGAS